jgi:hypothetical protein
LAPPGNRVQHGLKLALDARRTHPDDDGPHPIPIRFVAIQFLAGEDVRNPELTFSRSKRELKVRRHNPDDRERPPIESNRFADLVAISRKILFPKTITNYNDIGRRLGSFVGEKCASVKGLDSQKIKEIRRDSGAPNLDGIFAHLKFDRLRALVEVRQ